MASLTRKLTVFMGALLLSTSAFAHGGGHGWGGGNDWWDDDDDDDWWDDDDDDDDDWWDDGDDDDDDDDWWDDDDDDWWVGVWGWWWDNVCVDADGEFTSTVVAGPDCDSPIDFCTLGELSGDIVGTYAFAMDTMTPVPGEEDLGHFTFTGRSTITTDDGIIYGEDNGDIYFSGDFAFMTFVSLTDGTECWEDASGWILAEGNVDMTTGTTTGTWTSEVCGAAQCLEWDWGNGDCGW